MVPGIIYGGGQAPQNIVIEGRILERQLAGDAIYGHAVMLQLDAQAQQMVMLRDVMRHPVKGLAMHVDFQRVDVNAAVRLRVPLQFVGVEANPGVRRGGVVVHYLTDVEVMAPLSNPPEHITVELATLDIGESVHLSQLVLPEGVRLAQAVVDKEHDQPVVGVLPPTGGAGGEGEEAEAEA
jgi:large subunit ribosomal protein L25